MSNNYKFSTSMFIGDTTRGIEMPVFYDNHTPIFNNKPPGCLITGKPGSGKTFLALTLATISAILGKTTIVIDPKGDFLSLLSLEDQIGTFNLWSLDSRKKGMLDPFRMAKDPGEKLDLAITIIEIFVGELSPVQKYELSPILKDVIASKTPSLSRVVQELKSSESKEALGLGGLLDIISHLPLASLCFAPSGRAMDDVSIDSGLTVITLVGMDMPRPGQTQDNKTRLATGILFLLTDFIRRVMKDDKSLNPKTLIIDEAWSVLSTSAGADVIKEVALLGRSRSLALVLITQNNSHLKNLDIESTISSRFAFASTQSEADSIIKDMQLPTNEGFSGIISTLGEGECLMMDFQNRYSTVQISDWRADWTKAFSTNPLEKAMKQREEAAKGNK